MSQSALASGLAGQLELRRDLISQGYRPIGWKAGFGAPAWRERFRTDGPLIGFMTEATLLEDGAEFDISGWARPVAEPEIAAYLGSDLPPGSGLEETRAAISAIGPAIELADIDPPPEDAARDPGGERLPPRRRPRPARPRPGRRRPHRSGGAGQSGSPGASPDRPSRGPCRRCDRGRLPSLRSAGGPGRDDEGRRCRHLRLRGPSDRSLPGDDRRIRAVSDGADQLARCSETEVNLPKGAP